MIIENRQVIIIVGDSIIKNMPPIDDVVVKPFPGYCEIDNAVRLKCKY